MIAVDTSALAAILLAEEDAVRYSDALIATSGIVMSAVSYVELCAVMTKRRGAGVVTEVDDLIDSVDIRIEPVTVEQAQIAREAYVVYGVLNFGDVFSYALAKDRTIPLLFKGADFSKTDIESCL